MRVYKVTYRAEYDGTVVIDDAMHVRADDAEKALNIVRSMVPDKIQDVDDDDGTPIKGQFLKLDRYSTREVVDCGIELAN